VNSSRDGAIEGDDRGIGGNSGRPRSVARGDLDRARNDQAATRSAAAKPCCSRSGELFVEDLIEDEELVVTLTRAGYIKAVQADAFRAQARGGRGVQGTRLKEEDLIDQVLHTTAHSHLLLFSNRGKVYRLRAHEVPVKERNAREPQLSISSPSSRQRVSRPSSRHERSIQTVPRLRDKTGQVKKTAFSEYDKSAAKASSPST